MTLQLLTNTTLYTGIGLLTTSATLLLFGIGKQKTQKLDLPIEPETGLGTHHA